MCRNIPTVTIIIIGAILSPCLAEFAEVPADVIINIQAERAEFRCHHERADATIGWLVNDRAYAEYPDIVTRSCREDGLLVYILTIPARPQYNGTKIVCQAIFFSEPRELTPPATLIILIDLSMLSTTESPPTPTTGEILYGFQAVPSPVNVSVEQGIVTFTCQNPLADGIHWKLNGTARNRLNLPNITVHTEGTLHLLLIQTLSQYNNTTVECVASFDGFPSQSTPPVTLLIQGTPGTVNNATFERNYTSNAVTTLWNPLPSVDLTDTDPDVVYTLELFRITGGQNISISHKVMAESSATEEDLDMMQIYKVVIAAKNNVTGARNGPSVELKEAFMVLDGPTLFTLARDAQANITTYDPVPSSYTIILKSLDGLISDQLISNITVQRNDRYVTLTIKQPLPPKTLWNVSILAYGSEVDTVVRDVILSKFHCIRIPVRPTPMDMYFSAMGIYVSSSVFCTFCIRFA